MVDQAIILAAGLGSRLRPRSGSKPLTEIHGQTLMELGLRQLLAAGVTRMTIVTGYEAERVEAEAARLAVCLPAEIRTVRLSDYSRPNGWSVIAGAQEIATPFLLVMADHIFGDGILARLAAQSLGRTDVVLAVDAPDNPLLDPDDATWVAHDEARRITAIGKTIADYDVVDCGAFLADAGLPRAIERAIAQGKAGSLSEGMQVLADEGRAKTMDIGGVWWLDVDDPRSLDLAVEQAPRHIAALADAKAARAMDEHHV